MRKTFFAATMIAAGAVALFATSTVASACTDVTPNGRDTTNIRSGPSYDFARKHAVTSGLGAMRYCGTWSWDVDGRVDDNGHIFKWLYVTFIVDGWPSDGWVADVVVSY